MAGRSGNPRLTVEIVSLTNEHEEDMEEEHHEENMFKVPNLKRKLLADFGRPSVLELPLSDQMKVYLRIRPFAKDEIEKKEDQSCLTVDSETIVSTHAPKDSHYFKNTSRALTKTHMKYSFSKIFDEKTTQKQFFNETMLGLVKDFIEGQNCLVFSYGVTSSGKTYTIQGNPKDAGVLPRALDVLFNSISGKQYEGMNLKPTLFTNVQRLTPEQETVERRIKEKIMKLSCDDDMDVMSLLGEDASDVSVINSTISSEGSNISTNTTKDSFSCVEKLFDSLDDRVREEATVSVEDQGQIRFSVWVSFAEIYNEQIYDLLEVMPTKKNARRPCLKLSEDHEGSPYIKGLKSVNVTSADEAYRLLTIGQRNLQKACTKLNHNSSRSHCIFNIKVLRVVDKDDPQVARVSMLSLCDLAGSERCGKTQNTGERLKEAGNINTSLLTLGRCIQTLRHNQANKERTRIVPFRESKLTRLFQNFFVGRGKAAMFVNVNQCASMFDETQHVFKFSAVASQVVTQQKPVFIQPKLPVNVPIPRSSILWDMPSNRVQEGANVPLPGEDEDDDLEEEESPNLYTQENIDELLALIESLQNQLQEELREKARLESKTRAEVCQEMAHQFTKIEEQCSEQIRIREQMAEEMADKRIQIVIEAERAKRKKYETKTDTDDEWVSSVLMHQEKLKVQKLETTVAELTAEVTSLKTQLSGRNAAHDTLLGQKQELDSDLVRREEPICPTNDTKSEEGPEDEGQANVVENLTQQLQQSRDQIKEQEGEIAELNDMLTEAGDTFQQKETEIQKLKQLNQEYEAKMEKQSDALRLLERGISDSQVAMESADQTMSRSEKRVHTLNTDLEELKAEVKKYKNKARFFEEQVVEKEQECQHWRTRYEQDCEEHSKNQEALIHGFKAEISSLRAQLFAFKTQLHVARSPHKSPGGSLRSVVENIKSPAAKSNLFPVSASPNNISDDYHTPEKEGKSHSSPLTHVYQQQNINEDVGRQLQELQTEMDKNCNMIAELEPALQASRTTAEMLEKKLQAETEEHQKAVKKIEEMEAFHSALQTQHKDTTDIQSQYNNRCEEVENVNCKVKEFEQLIKEQGATITKLEEEKSSLKEELELSEKNREELHTRSEGLKDMVNKTTHEIQQRDNENQCLPPKEVKNSDQLSDQNEEFATKRKDIEKLKLRWSKLNKKYNLKETKLNEVIEKCNEFEFRINEKEFENQEQKKSIDDYLNKMESLQCSLNAKTEELCNTGEELALLQVESRRQAVELEQLKKEREKDIELVSTLQEKVQNAIKEKEELTTTVEQKKEEKTFENMKELIEKKEKEKNILKDNLQCVQNEMEKKEAELSDAIKKTETLEKKHDDLVTTLRNAEGERDSLKEELKKSQCVDSDIQKLREQILEKDEEINMFSQNLNAMLEEQEALQAKVEDLNRRVVETDQKMQEKDLIISKLTAEFELTKKTVDHMNDENEKMISQQKTIIKLETLVEELENKLENINSKDDEKINEFETSVLDLESAVADKEVELCSKEKIIEQKLEEIKMLKVKLLELKKKTNEVDSNVKLESDNKASEIRQMEKIIESLKLSAQNYEIEKCNNDKTLASRDQEVSELQMTVETLKTHLEKKSLEHEGGRQELEKRDQEIQQIQILNCENIEKMQIKIGAEKESLKSLLSGITDELDKSEEKNTGLEKKVQMQNNEMDIKTAEVNSYMNELAHAKESLKDTVEKVHMLEDELDEKSKEIDELKESLDELNMKLATDQDSDSRLNEALRETKDLKTSLHTHRTQHQKLKGDLEEALLEVQNYKGEIGNLKKSKNVHSEIYEQKNEELLKTQQQLNEKQHDTRALEEKLKEAMTSLQTADCDVECLKKDLNDKGNEIIKLKSEIDEKGNTILKLKSLLHNRIAGHGEDSLKELEELKVVNENHQHMSDTLRNGNKLLVDITQNESKSNKDDVLPDSDILKEWKRQFNEEKENLQTCDQNHQSPQTGVRKLRKEKIELQNSLVEINFKYEILEKELNEIKSKIRVEEIKPCLGETLNTCQDSVLQRKISCISTKLKETESSNRTLIKELSQLQSTVEKLQVELDEERQPRGGSVEKESLRRSHIHSLQSDPQRSVCSPESKLELPKSREREEVLEGQLTTAKGTIDEWLSKFSDVEAELVQKGQELTQAQENINVLQKQYSDESREMDKELKTLRETNKNLEYTKITLEGELQAMSILVDDINTQLDKVSAERDKYRTDNNQLKQFECVMEPTVDSKESIERLIKVEAERDSLAQQVSDLQKHIRTVFTEKETLSAVLKENNAELKELEKSLTVARQEIEDLKSEAGDFRQSSRVQHLESEKKAFEGKLDRLMEGKQEAEKKLDKLKEGKREAEKKLQEFRVERDKLVSGLEAVLKKKDADLKKHKEIIRQMKEREIQLAHTQSQSSIAELPESTAASPNSVSHHEETEIQVLDKSPGSRHRTMAAGPSLTSSTSVRRGRKRISPPEPQHLPSQPKRRSLEQSDSVTDGSEIETSQSQVSIDATPSSARTRRSRPNTTCVDEDTSTSLSRRPSRCAKQSARSRIMQCIKESPMAKTSKRLLDNIAETLSPKSPTRSPSKSPSNSPKKESSLERRRGSKRTLYTAKDVPEQPTGSTAPLDTKDLTPPREEIKITKTRSLRKRRT